MQSVKDNLCQWFSYYYFADL